MSMKTVKAQLTKLHIGRCELPERRDDQLRAALTLLQTRNRDASTSSPRVAAPPTVQCAAWPPRTLLGRLAAVADDQHDRGAAIMRQSTAFVLLAMLAASTAEAQTTTTTPTTTLPASSIPTSSALSVGPVATSPLTLPAPSGLGASQALPGTGSSASAAGPARSYAPAWILCLPDAPADETLTAGMELSCAP